MTPPPGPAAPFEAYPVPVTPPPGHGCLVLTVGRGPYLFSASAILFSIGGRKVPIVGHGPAFVPVPAGLCEVRLLDLSMDRLALATAVVPVAAGDIHHLSFQFGVVRNRVLDGAGSDVTKSALWSNYVIVLLGSVGVILLCCGYFFLIGLLDYL